MSDHTIMIIWIVKIFLYSSLYSCHLFLTSASVRSLLFLSFIELIIACNVPLVSLIFLKRSLVFSHSIVFLYFFALINEEGFLISPCYSLELYIQIVAYIYPTLYLLLLMNTTLLGALAEWFHKGTPNVIIFSFFPAGLMVFPREGSVILLSGETSPMFQKQLF